MELTTLNDLGLTEDEVQYAVIDAQPDFIDGSLGNANFKAKLGYIAEKIRNAVRPVAFTQDTHDENYANTLEGKNLPVPHCIKGTPGHKVAAELLSVLTKTPILIEKYTFGFTGWKEIFGDAEDIKAFYIMGTVNPICPVANAIGMRALYPNKRIIVDFAGCGFMADENGDETFCREATKYILTMQQIEVING